MTKAKFDKQKLLSVGVTAILIFFFIGGFAIGLDRVQSMEGTFPPNDIKEGISPAPDSVESAWNYYTESLREATEGPAKINTGKSYSINSDSLITDGSAQFKETVLFAKSNIEGFLSENTEKSPESNFGYDNTKQLGLFDVIDTENISEFRCNYIYYACPSCGLTNDEQLPECEPCGSQREYFKKYHPEYEVQFVIDADIKDENPELFDQLFAPDTDITVFDSINSATDGKFTVNSFTITYDNIVVTYKVNRLTDELTEVKYTKNMHVDCELVFSDEYDMLETKKISFDMSGTESFNLTWPALTLNEETLVIEPKNNDNLLATLTCEDPLAMTVTWSSSDESIATVDAEGYINTTKSTGEVTITATYEYLGNAYSDSCTVYVRVPVESMKMLKKSAKLSVGQTIDLETNVSPSDATVKTVKWYSEDEGIATVNEDGVVTAVSAGNVIVYAISDDGFYRSTCEVTVE